MTAACDDAADYDGIITSAIKAAKCVNKTCGGLK